MMIRPRRLRRTSTIRRMVKETIIRVDDLIYPVFVKHGKGEREPRSEEHTSELQSR